MRKIQIVTVGKVKEHWLSAALDDYVRRMRPMLAVEFLLLRSLPTHIAGRALALDERGEALDSNQFHGRIFSELEKGGSRLTLLIGAADGLPPEIKESVPLISLSKMTFTHQTTRLLLLEQLYRACEIEKGSRYVR